MGSVSSRSLMRQLAALRSFARHLEREGHGTASAFAAIRTPKVDKNLPRPLSASSAVAVTDAETRASENRKPWILARDAAVLSLLYGAGLRISEALGLQRRDAPVNGIDSITVTRQGRQDAQRAGDPTDPARGGGIPRALPLRDPAGGSALRRCARRRRFRRALSSSPSRSCAAPWGFPTAPRRTPCAIPSPPISCQGRRSARHPGIAGPRLALDDAALHEGRRGAIDGRVRRGASAGAPLHGIPANPVRFKSGDRARAPCHACWPVGP